MSDNQSFNNWQELTSKALESVGELFDEASRSLCKEFLFFTHDKLSEYSEKPSEGNKQGFEFLHAQSRLNHKNNEITRIFLRELRVYFEGLTSHKFEARDDFDSGDGAHLSLVNQDEFDENIALVATRQRAEGDYSEQLWMLTQRLSLITGGKKIQENELPMAPGCFCSAIKRAMVVADIQLSAKLVVYKLFEKKVISQLGDLYDQMNEILVDMGILPNLRYKVKKAEGADSIVSPVDENQPEKREAEERASGRRASDHAVGRRAADQMLGLGGFMAPPSPSLPAGDYQRQLVENIHVLQERLAGHSSVAPVAGGVGSFADVPATGSATGSPVSGAVAFQPVVYSSAQLMQAAAQVQQSDQAVAAEGLIATGNIQPLDIAQARDRLVAQLQEVAGSDEPPELSADHMRTIELVGLLFEYILNDQQVPDSVKTTLSFLHTPFLKLAFSEVDFFTHHEHPARLLLNSLADAGAKWVGNDDSSQFSMLDQIRKTVREVLDEYEVDTKLFARLLLEFNSFVQKIELRVQLLEKRATEKARGEDRLREVKQRINKEIHERIAEKDIPTAILLFLLQPWSDYMAFVLLRYGEESESWNNALTLVDDMLWGVELPDSDSERLRWKKHYPWMQDVIQKGFDMIGYDTGKAVKLKRSIDRLYKLRETNVEPEHAAEEVRDKLVKLAEQKAGEKVNVDSMGEKELVILDKLRLMEFGTWFEHRDGRREKVAWFNSKTLQFLFVDQSGKRSGIKTGEELVHALVAGDIKMIIGSIKPLVERTMESIFSDLNTKAQALSDEGAKNVH
ncbi:MAG: DUF1631 family protein [Porticoccus sp.]|nr:DUF1631 family protein [Porticoccus sp.]